MAVGILAAAFFGLRESDTGQGPGDGVTGEQMDDISFRLKWLAYNSFASHYVAQEYDFFANENLNVDIQQGGPGRNAIMLVAGGESDVGLASYEEILIAREKGIPVIAIAEDFVRSGVGFVSLAENGITSPSAFEGRRMAIRPGTDKHMIYEALAEKEGINRATIEEINSTNFDLVLTGALDIFPGFVTNQPFYARHQGKEVNVVDPYDYGIRPGSNVYFTTESFLRDNEELLTRFLRASVQARNFSMTLDDEAVIDVVLKQREGLQREPELAGWKKTKEVLFQQDESLQGYMPPEKWDYTADLAYRYGLLKEMPDVSAAFTNRLLFETPPN
ncbi:MAG: ABC transporter substrate-binding protein [Alphaproteobacteria bacterium]